MPVQGGEAVRVAEGFGCRESDDRKWLYTAKFLGGGKAAILRTPVGGGAQTLVFDDVTARYWTIAGKCLDFINVDARLHATVNCFDHSEADPNRFYSKGPLYRIRLGRIVCVS
jgi:hypothetical protein